MILTVPPRDNFGGTTMFFKICTPYFKKGFFMILYRPVGEKEKEAY